LEQVVGQASDLNQLTATGMASINTDLTFCDIQHAGQQNDQSLVCSPIYCRCGHPYPDSITIYPDYAIIAGPWLKPNL
jgi:hypothetical protein